MGTANLNVIFGSQNYVFEKAGTGYKIGFQGKQKKYNNFFKTNMKQVSLPITCFYCMRKGHSVKNCKIKKIDVPKRLVRWVPKSITNNSGPKFNRLPKPQT